MSSDEEDSDCPLCMEELDIADRNFRPCPCGYQICRFCWHHIKTNLNGRCPACRRLYSDQIVEFVPVSAEEIMRLKKEKKEKDRQTRDMRDPSRRQLSNVRVVQKNLVYVLGLSLKHASVDNEFFKKYGRIDKVVISKRSAPSSGSNSSVGIYVTFARKEDAGRAIEGLNGLEYEGKTLRASYGTTKYCTYYLRHMSCPNPNCMYLHEPGDDVDSYSKDTVAIGKHANTYVSSSTGASTYPNKRPATAATALKPTPAVSASSTTTASATTPEPKPATVPRTWAPIPKVVPIPPVVIPEPPVVVAAAPPSPPFKEIVKPSASNTKKSSAPIIKPSKSTATSSKKPAPKKIVVPLVEEDEKPALPATASWANAQPVVNHESVITPANFGPSLSDALNAPQKPKHYPSLKVKKEKKSKGKMVRLEEFEEAEREAKMAAARPKVVPKPPVAAAPVVVNEAPAKPVQQVSDTKVNHAAANNAQPAATGAAAVVSEEAREQPAAVVETKKETVDQVKSEEVKSEETVQKSEMVEIKKTTHAPAEKVVEDNELVATETVSQDLDEQVEDEVMEKDDVSEEAQIDDQEATDEVMNEDTEEDLVEEEEEEGDNEKIEDLATLNDEIIKAFDNAANESSEKVQADGQQEANDVLSEHEPTEPQQTISSPMAAMDRLSALVQQEIMTDSPEPPQFDEQQQQPPQFQPHPGMNRFDMGMPMQDNRRSPMPPPGLGGGVPPPPPDWMNRSFDPFNGQDPSLIAARRLQHSQRMLEASGLFGGGGFGHPPVVPRFGFSPDFNHGPHFPHQPPPPPLGMFPGPPPPHPMMRGPPPPPEMINMQSPFGPPPAMQQQQQQMDDLRNEFGAMKMNNGEDHQSREDSFRALLPNVNISFNNLQEKRRAEEFYQQQLLMRQQQQMQRMSEQERDIPTHSPMRHPSFNNAFQHHPSQEKILLRSPANNNWQQQQQLPPGMMMENNNNENVDLMDENKRNNPDVRVEAQNFFGEFLRKAASSTTPQPEMSPKKEEQPIQPATSLPFQDPAIMSVRLVGNDAPVNEVVRSQNTILQILGGQPPPPSPLMSLEQQQHHQQQMHQQQQQQQQQQQFFQHRQQQQQQQQQQQRQMDPRFVMEQQGRMMHQQEGGNFNDMGGPKQHFNNVFMGPPPNNNNFQQQQPQQQPPPFHQQQPGNMPPPPSNFMPQGFREPNMGMMGRMGPPPGMMRSPMLPPPNDMRFRNGHMGNGQPPPPPRMFSAEEGHH